VGAEREEGGQCRRRSRERDRAAAGDAGAPRRLADGDRLLPHDRRRRRGRRHRRCDLDPARDVRGVRRARPRRHAVGGRHPGSGLDRQSNRAGDPAGRRRHDRLRDRGTARRRRQPGDRRPRRAAAAGRVHRRGGVVGRAVHPRRRRGPRPGVRVQQQGWRGCRAGGRRQRRRAGLHIPADPHRRDRAADWRRPQSGGRSSTSRATACSPQHRLAGRCATARSCAPAARPW